MAPASPTRRAVIDVGTNSVKLLVADVSGRCVNPLLERSHQTRLGAGFYETHLLQRAAIEKTAETVANFAREAARWLPQSVRVIATSAARDAKNQAELRMAIEQAAGLIVEIISGEQEADWVFAGVTSDPKLGSQPLVIMDVGGGSAEFILSNGLELIFRQSFPLGTVRLLERIRPSDPPLEGEWSKCKTQLQDFLNDRIRPRLEEPLRRCAGRHVQLVATGGSASILAAMQLELTAFDRNLMEALQLTFEQVRQRQRHLWSLPLAQRKTLVGLPPNRADVILMGVAIFAEVMEQFEFPNLRISTRGLRFAAIMDP
ncbi:MAG: hypothetical protein HY735_31630 [Verrucomicrobia bacterium]|nr:hypothetical protein [Verrucomicrobiota bacterium]